MFHYRKCDTTNTRVERHIIESVESSQHAVLYWQGGQIYERLGVNINNQLANNQLASQLASRVEPAQTTA